jgi:hypothetical protein
VSDDWSCRANYTTSKWRAVGGHLRIAEGRLVFEPHGFDKALAGRGWAASPAEIEAIDVAPRDPFGHFFGGGLRKRLRVSANGEEAYFVVNKVEQVAEDLRTHLAVVGEVDEHVG